MASENIIIRAKVESIAPIVNDKDDDCALYKLAIRTDFKLLPFALTRYELARLRMLIDEMEVDWEK